MAERVEIIPNVLTPADTGEGCDIEAIPSPLGRAHACRRSRVGSRQVVCIHDTRAHHEHGCAEQYGRFHGADPVSNPTLGLCTGDVAWKPAGPVEGASIIRYRFPDVDEVPVPSLVGP